jgi:hypothetical protein
MVDSCEQCNEPLVFIKDEEFLQWQKTTQGFCSMQLVWQAQPTTRSSGWKSYNFTKSFILTVFVLYISALNVKHIYGRDN